jgi:hypothetical protein
LDAATDNRATAYVDRLNDKRMSSPTDILGAYSGRMEPHSIRQLRAVIHRESREPGTPRRAW